MRRNFPARLASACLAFLLMVHFTPLPASLAGAVARLADEVAQAAEACTGMMQQAGEELIYWLLRQ